MLHKLCMSNWAPQLHSTQHDVGSYAARTKNYWTNLSSSFVTRLVYDMLKFWHEGDLYDILELGRHPM
jgi:hypothetical protein